MTSDMTNHPVFYAVGACFLSLAIAVIGGVYFMAKAVQIRLRIKSLAPDVYQRFFSGVTGILMPLGIGSAYMNYLWHIRGDESELGRTAREFYRGVYIMFGGAAAVLVFFALAAWLLTSGVGAR